MSVIWSGITEEGAIVPVQVDSTGKVIATADVADNYVEKSGDTMTGPLILSGNPTQSLQAATKDYVDSSGGGGGSSQAWGSIDQNGGISSSFNVARVTTGAEGIYLVTFQNPLPNPDYAICINPKSAARYLGLEQIDNTGFVVQVYSRSSGALQRNNFYFSCFSSDEQYKVSRAE